MDDNAVEFTKELATQIEAINRGMANLLDGPLARRAILVLLRDQTGLAVSTLDRVLCALSGLKAAYLKSVGTQ